MRFEALPAFEADFAALPTEHRRMFLERIREFSSGCDQWNVEGPEPHPWSAGFRVHQLANTDVWSMTWHYRRPDGRATFRFVPIEGQVYVQWRRIGGHDIYDAP